MKLSFRRTAARTAHSAHPTSVMTWLPLAFALVPLGVLLWAIPLTSGHPVG